MERAVGQSDAGACDLRDGVLHNVDDVDVFPVELLVVPGVAERAAGVELLGRQLASLFGILDDLGDLALDEVARRRVGGLVCHQVGKGPDEESDAAAFLPGLLIDLLSLFGRDVQGFALRFLEPAAGE